MIIALKIILAFCSICYELLLAQGLSVFLDNTVLRYCTTIGMYMFAMGVGAWCAGWMQEQRSAVSLWQAEIGLVFFGAGGFVSLFLFSSWPYPLLILWAYFLVFAIGWLTGLELPFLLSLARQSGRPARSAVLAAEYVGAFLGSMAFVFIFYPVLGLTRAVMLVAFFNTVAALGIAWWRGRDFAQDAGVVFGISLFLVGVLALWVILAPGLEIWLSALYVKGAHGG